MASLTGLTSQQRRFQERLERIARGGPHTLGRLHAGASAPGAAFAPAGRTRGRKRTLPPAAAKPGGGSIRGGAVAGGLFGGILLGALAVLLVRYARFRLTGTALGEPDADLLLAVDVVLAITLAIMLRALFRGRSWLHGFGKLLGVGAMVLSMHNLVHLAPEPFSRSFSPQWVESVVSQTAPGTLLMVTLSGTAPTAGPASAPGAVARISPER